MRNSKNKYKSNFWVILLSLLLSLMSLGISSFLIYETNKIENKYLKNSNITDITNLITWVNSGDGRYLRLNLSQNDLQENNVYYLDIQLNCQIRERQQNLRTITFTVLGGEKGQVINGSQFFSFFIDYTPDSATKEQYTINTLIKYGINQNMIQIFIIPYLDKGFVFPKDNYDNFNGCAVQNGTKIFLRSEIIDKII